MKKWSVKSIFIALIVATGFSMLLSFLVLILMINLTIGTGFIIPADRQERQVESLLDDMKSADRISTDAIPEEIKYVFFDENQRVIDSTMDEEGFANVSDFVSGGQEKYYSGTRYYVKETLQGQTIVFEYRIQAQFAIAKLNQILPSVEFFDIIIAVVLIIINVLIVIWLFARYFRKRLMILKEAADQIQLQNLDFTVKSTGIREFDIVAESLDSLRKNLAESLKSQWAIEQQTKEQMSALAHDIKTPLTIISGNAQLLEETEQTSMQQEYTSYILSNTDQIRDYLTQLIEISKTGRMQVVKEKISLREFLTELQEKCEPLLKSKQLVLVNTWAYEDLPELICVDHQLLLRALLNVVENAVEYAPQQSVLHLEVYQIQKKIRESGQDVLPVHLGGGAQLVFCVKDQGPGFTPEALKQASVRFYRASPTRNAASHFGLGLFIAQNVAMIHQGQLILKNCEEPEQKGAIVELTIGID